MVLRVRTLRQRLSAKPEQIAQRAREVLAEQRALSVRAKATLDALEAQARVVHR